MKIASLRRKLFSNSVHDMPNCAWVLLLIPVVELFFFASEPCQKIHVYGVPEVRCTRYLVLIITRPFV